jgi:hypothetical protein
MNVTDPIRRVSVVSTGEVQIHPGAADRLAQATGQAPILASA